MSPTDIRELFTDAADDSQRSQIDAAALLARGKRKVRLRRAGAAAGTGLLAAAAVAGVTQLPSDRADGPVPPAQTPVVPSVTTVSNSASASLPPPVSVTTSKGPQSAVQTSGTELIRKLPYAEAVRRCKVRMQAEYGASGTPVPVVIGPGESQKDGLYVTDQLPVKMPDGSTAYCSVPGTAQPSYDGPATIGDARAECGRLTWTNLTSWTVAEQRDPSGGLTATLSSPDRRAVLRCDRDPDGAVRVKETAFPDAYVYLVYGPRSGKPVGSAPNGVVGSAPDATAVHALGASKDGRSYWGGGGIAKQGAVRYALFAGATKLGEAKVSYGIYALRVWLPAGSPEPDRVVAYDSAGKVIEDYQPV